MVESTDVFKVNAINEITPIYVEEAAFNVHHMHILRLDGSLAGSPSGAVRATISDGVAGLWILSQEC